MRLLEYYRYVQSCILRVAKVSPCIIFREDFKSLLCFLAGSSPKRSLNPKGLESASARLNTKPGQTYSKWTPSFSKSSPINELATAWDNMVEADVLWSDVLWCDVLWRIWKQESSIQFLFCLDFIFNPPVLLLLLSLASLFWVLLSPSQISCLMHLCCIVNEVFC